MQARPFKLLAGHVALDFVNTLDDVYAAGGPSELVPTYADLLRFARQASLLDQNEAAGLQAKTSGSEQTAALETAHVLRGSLGTLFFKAANRTAMESDELRPLNEVLTEALASRALALEEDRVSWAWAERQASARLPVWMLALSGADLLMSGNLDSVKACANQTCRWLFLDTSKNRKRRWCDMQLCGNRAKARTHYRRSTKKVDQIGND